MEREKEKEGPRYASPSRVISRRDSPLRGGPFLVAHRMGIRWQPYLSQRAARGPCRFLVILGTAPRVPKGYRESQFLQ